MPEPAPCQLEALPVKADLPTSSTALEFLCKAAGSGDIARAEALMEGARIEIGTADEQGWTALHAAVQAGKYEMVSWLLEVGASPTAETSQGVTPLSLAEDANHSDVAALLQEWMDLGQDRCPFRYNKAEAVKWVEGQVEAGRGVIYLYKAWLEALGAGFDFGNQLLEMLASNGYLKVYEEEGGTTEMKSGLIVFQCINKYRNEALWTTASNSSEADNCDGSLHRTSCKDGDAANNVGSRTLCNHKNCRPVIFDHQSVSDTVAEEEEEGMSLGGGSLTFCGKQRLRLVWEQTASWGEIREIGFEAAIMFRCCMTEERTCIILEQLKGFLCCGTHGVSLDSITVSMQAKGMPGGKPEAVGMQEPQAMTWSEHTAKYDFVMKERKWHDIKSDQAEEDGQGCQLIL